MSAEKLGPRFAGADGTPAAKSSGKLEKIKVPTAAEAQAKREAKEREKPPRRSGSGDEMRDGARKSARS